MKIFLKENWYKLMIGSSLLMASFGFMVYAVNPAKAADSNNLITKSDYGMIPLNTDGTISVKLSDEQLNKIIPKNADGSINVKLSESQLKAIGPNAIQSVNISQILGMPAAGFEAYKEVDGTMHYGLGVDRNPW